MRRMYSENQIKKLAKYVAENDLSDLDLKVKTVSQSEANEVASTDISISSATIAKGVTLVEVYNRVEEINGILYLVFCNKFVNNTESAITLSYSDNIRVDIEVSSSIAEKIFDQNDVPVSSGSSSNVMIAGGDVGLSRDGASYWAATYRLLNQGVANKMSCIIQTTRTSGTLAVGGEFVLEARTFLTLI